jgi:DNA-binding CsgD family transcriptional regulator
MVRRFINKHTSPGPAPNAIFLREWKKDWRKGTFPVGQSPFQNTHILSAKKLDAQQKNALTVVCDSMLRFHLDSATPYYKGKHAEKLVDALNEYLALRGYDVSTCADETEIDKGAGGGDRAKGLSSGGWVKRAPPTLPPLSDREREVYDVIRQHGHLTGKQIANRTGIGEKTLTRHIIPTLKLRGLRNRRGVGYYFPDQGGERA